MARKGQLGPVHRGGPGEVSLSMGIIALICSVIPIVGDFLAVPTGLLALVLGVVGVRRSERGVASNFGESLIGATLGTLALFVVLLMFFVSAK